MQLSVEEVKKKIESLLWHGEGNFLWGFCYQQQISESVTENRRAGYAIQSARLPTELTIIATGLYRILDPDYKPILIDDQDPWPGYKVNNETRGVDLEAWRDAIKETNISVALIKHLYSDLFDAASKFYDKSNEDGVLHVLPWIQSPVDTVSALYTPWRFLEEITFNESAVISDLEFVTEFTIEFIKAFKETFPGVPPYCLEKEVWMPDGVCLWEDQMDLFSRFLPEGFYERLAMPFSKGIADEFGGVGLHTCGEVTDYVLEPLSRYENLLAFQYDAAQTPTRRVLDSLGDRKLAIVPRYSFAGIDKNLRPNTQIQNPIDYARAMLDDWHSGSHRASMFLVIPQSIESLLIQKKYKSKHEALHSDVEAVVHNKADIEEIFEALNALGLKI